MKTTRDDPALLVGLDVPDDAAVYVVAPERAIVQTVDYFTPIVDDAFAWGRIAAANALSDVYAMGARPVIALNLIGWPRALGFELLGRVLDGAAEACEEATTAIVGGHSVDDPEPKYGLAVTGLVHPDRVVRKTGARVGDRLVLTKPLGTGIISSALKEGAAPAPAVDAAVASMGKLNASAAQVMLEVGVSAATDVTGFGFAGHLLQMLDGGIDARVGFDSIPLLPGALELCGKGILPGGSRRNRQTLNEHVDVDGLDETETWMLFDAQTSGGLLMAIPPDRASRLVDRLGTSGVQAAEIGEVADGSGRISVRR